jgi:hypothetical protein
MSAQLDVFCAKPRGVSGSAALASKALRVKWRRFMVMMEG